MRCRERDMSAEVMARVTESRQRSVIKTLTSAATGAVPYGLASHAITTNHKQSLALAGLAAVEGLVKIAGAYQYERWFVQPPRGRSRKGTLSEISAADHPARLMFKAAGWFISSTGMDPALAYIATHDSAKAANFIIYRGAGRQTLSHSLERLWSRIPWGVTTTSPGATEARPGESARTDHAGFLFTTRSEANVKHLRVSWTNIGAFQK